MGLVSVFNIMLALTILVVVVFIIRAVKQTKSELDKKLEGVNRLDRDEMAKKMVKEMQERAVRCPKCQGQTNALLGTDDEYKCISCNHKFTGPAYIPDPKDLNNT